MRLDTALAVVLDVGKTNAKLSLWTASGVCLAQAVRRNRPAQGPGYRALDVEGVSTWLRDRLSAFVRHGDVRAIIPVAHGAAAALVRGGELFLPPMDYEDDIPAQDREAYGAGRDPFGATGSPALPLGLNLGIQLHRLEALTGPWPDELTILTWPQYWAWRLCGVAASEVSSLGCHTDLWLPYEGRPSAMACRRGWANRLAPLHSAREKLGTLAPEWVQATGISPECVVLCGLHDSNAALLAARGGHWSVDRDTTVLSTGTWFVAMRSAAPDAEVDCSLLCEARDCLVNVDVDGRVAPSARFMGGREAELVVAEGLARPKSSPPLSQRLHKLMRAGVRLLPTFTPGVGPFPGGTGRWENRPASVDDRRLMLSLYLALMADATLDLIGSRDQLVVEGRFADDEDFIAALAALRPGQELYRSGSEAVPYGALRLFWSELAPPEPPVRVEPPDLDLSAYRRAWRAAAQNRSN